MRNPSTSVNTSLLVAQGAYYLATGLWPIFDRDSFERVTGPKTDFWLVRTVGALVGVIGSTMLLAARLGRPGFETRVLAGGTAGALAAIDTTYAVTGRIPKIYLIDAAVEAVLVGGWLFAAGTAGRARRLARPELLVADIHPD